MKVKLKKCLQCGSNLIDEFTNGKTGDAMFECQWCGRYFDQDEIDYCYFEESAIVEGLKHLCSYAAENGGKIEYLNRLSNFRNRKGAELKEKYEVID